MTPAQDIPTKLQFEIILPVPSVPSVPSASEEIEDENCSRLGILGTPAAGM